GALANSVVSVTSLDNQVYAAINAQGILSLQGGAWIQQPYLQSESFKRISGISNKLIITTTDGVWSVSGGVVEEIGVDSFTKPDEALSDAEGVIWIADGASGLLSIKEGVVNSVKPNGPSSNTTWRLTYSHDRIVHSKGGFSGSLQPLENVSSVDQFVNGKWSVLPSELKIDVTDQEINPNTTYISSFSFGLEKITSEGSVIFDESNSPLLKAQPMDKLLIPSVEVSADQVWVANYGVSPSLHLLSGPSTWESFSLNQTQAQFPVDILVDRSGLVWAVIDPLKGGGVIVFDKNENRSVYLTNLAGSGGLPSPAVRSIANDRDGQVWIGTDMGVVFFTNPGNVFSSSLDASRPIFE
ncbi:MAG: two-component regulator propeller domain-containing protein, partial [Cyclobacteriaceae bacterium]